MSSRPFKRPRVARSGAEIRFKMPIDTSVSRAFSLDFALSRTRLGAFQQLADSSSSTQWRVVAAARPLVDLGNRRARRHAL